jgi:hypothetical protein
MLFKKNIILIILLSISAPVFAENTLKPAPLLPLNSTLYDKKPWALMYYYGWTVSDPLWRIFTLDTHRWPEHIQSAELGKTLDKDNFFRKLVSPLVDVVQVVGNMTIRQGKNESTIYEFDPYLSFRWANWPWNDHVVTSLAVGEGISYATSVPNVEIRNNKDTKRLLNYLMLEAAFAMPSHPDVQFIARIHHRSGAFGLYHAGNTGSNDIGVGIRYLFD